MEGVNNMHRVLRNNISKETEEAKRLRHLEQDLWEIFYELEEMRTALLEKQNKLSALIKSHPHLQTLWTKFIEASGINTVDWAQFNVARVRRQRPIQHKPHLVIVNKDDDPLGVA
jgi:hypothetical protein